MEIMCSNAPRRVFRSLLAKELLKGYLLAGSIGGIGRLIDYRSFCLSDVAIGVLGLSGQSCCFGSLSAGSCMIGQLLHEFAVQILSVFGRGSRTVMKDVDSIDFLLVALFKTQDDIFTGDFYAGVLSLTQFGLKVVQTPSVKDDDRVSIFPIRPRAEFADEE